jgi:hypothetical protein
VIILPNCLRTHLCTYILNRVEHKRLVGGTCAEQARGVCAINPGAQNFHSPAFIVLEQHLTDVSARGAAATGSFACNRGPLGYSQNWNYIIKAKGIGASAGRFLSEHIRRNYIHVLK